MDLNRARKLAGLEVLKEDQPASKVSEINGFKANDKVTVTDSGAKPPQTYNGTIKSVWSNGTAMINFYPNLNTEAEKHLVSNGMVDLHHCQKMNEAVQKEFDALLLTEAASSFKLALHYSKKGNGQSGDIYTFTGDGIELLASLFGVASGWKEPKKVFDGLYGSYNDGDRLTLFKNAQDYEADFDQQED